MLSLKSCPKCNVEGFFNADEIYCWQHPRTKLIPMTLIPTTDLAALREAGKKMEKILKWELNEGNLKDSETLAALEAWEAANK